MKKFLTSFVTVLLAVLLVFIAACTDNGGDNGGDNNVPTGPVTYTVSVLDTGNNPVSAVSISLVDDGNTLRQALTDENGQVSFENVTRGVYDVEVSGLPAGFSTTQASYTTDIDGTPISIRISSSLIMDDAPAGTTYEEGDVIHNFTYEALSYDDDGNIVREEKTLAEAFANGKEMILLNFFFTTCGPCEAEFPAMIEAYEGNDTYAGYDDVVEIISIDDYPDLESEVVAYKDSMGIPWDVAWDYNAGTYAAPFNISVYPTNIIIDRYGVICSIDTGSVTDANTFRNWFEKYTGDDYEQEIGNDWELTPPNVENPDIEDVAAAISSTSLEGKGITFEWDYTSEYNWPWLVGETGDYIYSSNSGYAGSWSLLNIRFTLDEGEILAFDYRTSSETSDILYAVVDSMIVGSYSGVQDEWQTCYAFVGDGTEHILSLTYQKDTGSDVEEDRAYVSNLRITNVAELNQNNTSLNILRQAATNLNDDDAENPYYEDYVDIFYNEEDGYYHVGSVDGPYLLTDLINDTLWGEGIYGQALDARTLAISGSLEEDDPRNVLVGSYLGTDADNEPIYEKFKQIEDYAWYCRYSTTTQMANSLSQTIALTPVTEELRLLLVEIVAALGNDDPNDNQTEWLETCRYYVQYGASAEAITDPIAGLTIDTAVMAHLGDQDVYTRPKSPRGMFFEFTPTVTHAYRFTSSDISVDGTGASIWLFLEDTYGGDVHNPIYIAEAEENGDDGNFDFVYELETGVTYYVACALSETNLSGGYTLNISYYDEDFIFRPVASNVFSYVEDSEEVYLTQYVDVGLGSDGYYYASDIETGHNYSRIFVDFANGTSFSLSALSEWLEYQTLNIRDENNNIIQTIEGYGFDFTENGYYKKYYDYLEEEYNDALAAYIADGGTRDEYVELNGEFVNRYDLLTDEQKQDFTAIMTEYNQSRDAVYGLVEADEKLVEILQILMILEDRLTDNAWMQLCYYVEEFNNQAVTE